MRSRNSPFIRRWPLQADCCLINSYIQIRLGCYHTEECGGEKGDESQPLYGRGLQGDEHSNWGTISKFSFSLTSTRVPKGNQRRRTHAKSRLYKEKALGIEPWTLFLFGTCGCEYRTDTLVSPFIKPDGGKLNQAGAHISSSTHWTSTVGLTCSEQSETFITGFNVLARGASLSSHFDINSVNAPDLPLGPSIQKCAALPSIVGTYTSSGKILVNSPRGAWRRRQWIWGKCQVEKRVESILQINHYKLHKPERKWQMINDEQVLINID